MLSLMSLQCFVVSSPCVTLQTVLSRLSPMLPTITFYIIFERIFFNCKVDNTANQIVLENYLEETRAPKKQEKLKRSLPTAIRNNTKPKGLVWKETLFKWKNERCAYIYDRQ